MFKKKWTHHRLLYLVVNGHRAGARRAAKEKENMIITFKFGKKNIQDS